MDDSWEEVRVDDTPNEHYFDYRNIRYVYDAAEELFVVPQLRLALPMNEIHAHHSSGIALRNHFSLSKRYGPNSINVPVPTIAALLLQEVLHPFYLFQVASCILWFFTQYYWYAGAIIIMSSASVIWTVVFSRRNLSALNAVARSETHVNCWRDGHELRVHSADLVPGDRIAIDSDMEMPCDAVLLEGEAVVNEAMLTGESVSVVAALMLFPLLPGGLLERHLFSCHALLIRPHGFLRLRCSSTPYLALTRSMTRAHTAAIRSSVEPGSCKLEVEA